MWTDKCELVEYLYIKWKNEDGVWGKMAESTCNKADFGASKRGWQWIWEWLSIRLDAILICIYSCMIGV